MFLVSKMKLLVALLVAMELVGSTRGLIDRLYCGKDNCYEGKAHTVCCLVLSLAIFAYMQCWIFLEMRLRSVSVV